MSFLLENGWDYIPNIIDKEEAKTIKEKILLEIINNNGNLNYNWDPDRGNILFLSMPSCCSHIMTIVKPKLENLIGEEIIPTYWFSTTYHNKGMMVCHTDRPSCEISISMNISGDAKWPLKLKDLKGNRQEVITPAGDGVAYLGMEVPHWRSPLKTHEEDKFMQLFLHFVRKNGKYSRYAYDNNRKVRSLLLGKK